MVKKGNEIVNLRKSKTHSKKVSFNSIVSEIEHKDSLILYYLYLAPFSIIYMGANIYAQLQIQSYKLGDISCIMKPQVGVSSLKYNTKFLR